MVDVLSLIADQFFGNILLSKSNSWFVGEGIVAVRCAVDDVQTAQAVSDFGSLIAKWPGPAGSLFEPLEDKILASVLFAGASPN